MNPNNTSLNKLKSFSIRIAEHLYERFSKHIQLLKYVRKTSKNKAKWIEESFIEKLERERELSFDTIPDEKILHFKIDEQLYQEIEDRVNIIKKFRNYSKKQWMVEAIYEKLEREEQEAKRLMQNMLQEASKREDLKIENEIL
ncbi:hypothetical protein [Candidatus Protochlamydia phocaeensis]|uniref:hypothetical protein n=1 Tax=Candidatus Protochlamydia phocaeensis TaxID=1414722 RepID=UPI000838752C|nr:hypothetical protein [Candidatus Protochlamydia phocaeensis]